MDAINLLSYKGSRKVLEILRKFPNRHFTINELATEAGVPFASTWRLVKKWEPAGLIETNRIGKSVAVKLNDSPYLKSITRLLAISASPQAFAANRLKVILAKENGVKHAYLFGSVAAGTEKPESDIDVAILATSSFDPNKLVFDVYEKNRAKIVPIVFNSEKEFNSFLKDKAPMRKIK